MPLLPIAIGVTFFWGSPFVGSVTGDDSPTPDASSPHWIWSPGNTDRDVSFSRSFELRNPAAEASLRCASHSAGLEISLNGEWVATLEPYDPLLTLDLTPRLGGGSHELTVTADPVDGPAAFFVLLEIDLGDGSHHVVVSDTAWRVGSGTGKVPAVSRGVVDQRLVLPAGRRAGVTALDNYEQWKQALGTGENSDPASFWVAPGFEISLVRSAEPHEGSWVSLVTDPQGRLLIAKEDRGLLRMTLSADGSRVTTVETVEETLEECRGLVFVGEDLYVNANNSKGLFRLRSVPGGAFASPELVFASSGGVGHGRNDLALGPDGMIYSIHGDAVDLPSDGVDHTSPFREARRGDATREGHLLRIDPHSGAVEVLVAGLRNPFGIDFNQAGDIFTYDADAEYDMGSPWYRPTRVHQLLTGGDYGWRGVTQSWPSYYPDQADFTQPNLDIGKGSPTAVKFGTRSHFPPRYREALFVLDWAYGRVIAVHCLPRGSSYLMSAETFLQGRPLNVTDIDFASDGSLYLVTGGRKTRSALYRVRFQGDREADDMAVKATPETKARHDFASQARELRRSLVAGLRDRFKGLRDDVEPARIDHAWEQLGHSDPWISQAAVHLLERTPVEEWKDRALAEEDLDRAFKALLSLARAGDPEWFPAIVGRLNELTDRDQSRTQKLTAYRAYALCLTPEWIDDANPMVEQTRRVLDANYPERSYVLNRALSDLLVRVASPTVVPKTLELVRSTDDQVQQMQYLYVLRTVRNGWSDEDRKVYFAALNRSRDWVSGAGMSDFIKRIREEAIATLTDTERQRLDRYVDPQEDSGVSDAERSVSRPFVRNWTVDEIAGPAPNDSKPDLLRGRRVFGEAACIQCHRIGVQGRSVGPDLTAASRRFSRRDLVASIVEPSKVIAENYRSLQVVTRDGKAYVGQVVLGGDYRSPKLRLATDPNSPRTIVEIDKASIETQKTSSVSWMPKGLLDHFTRNEILDLLAFIESGGAISATR